MAETLDLSIYVKRQDDGMAHLDLAIEGIDCAACIDEIEGGLCQLPGVVEARLNYTNHRLAVEWRDGELSPAAVVEELQRLGYRAHPFQPRLVEEEETRRAKWLLKCLAVAGFAAMNIMLLAVSVWSGNVTDITPEIRDFFHWLAALIALPAVAYAGQPFFQSAMGALRNGRTNMDVPVTIGILLALIMSVIETINHAEHTYFDSVVMLLFFLLCGRYLDQAMRRKTRAVAGNLAALRTEVAHRIDESGEPILVPTAALNPGDRVLVRPGERISVDGVILSGSSELDESLVTGETICRPGIPGDAVYAGSLNYSGTLTVHVTAGTGTLLDKVERLLETASAARSRYVQLADKVARAYAPVVHLAALLTAVIWVATGASLHDALITAVAVLIITCPCALALAVPVVQVVASGALFRSNVFLNAGDALERLAAADTVVFDKTGTLTLPDMRIANAGRVRPDLLEAAARLALSSHHPLANAVAQEARLRIPYEEAVEEAGQGVRVIVNGVELRLGSLAYCGASDLLAESVGREADVSVIAFARGDERTILFVRQALRPDAASTVKALQDLGLDCRILSGDRPEAVAPIAAMLGIEEWKAGANPADKIAVLEGLKAQGRKVLMVGDGLNDAPALAAADVSASPITASDLTQAQADAVFLGDKLAPVADAVTIARQAHRLMRQNLLLALIYNLIAVPLAFLGYVTPLVAALAMSGSSSLVTLNALRARGRKRQSNAAQPSQSISAVSALQGA